MKQFYIPRLGEEFELARKWDFDLFPEYRNVTLFEHLGLECDDRWYVDENGEHHQRSTPASLKAGEKLKLDRIYIRKGAEDFDSVSFFLLGAKTKNRVEKRTAVEISESGKSKRFEYEQKVAGRPVRFWVKLNDANKIQFK